MHALHKPNYSLHWPAAVVILPLFSSASSPQQIWGRQAHLCRWQSARKHSSNGYFNLFLASASTNFPLRLPNACLKDRRHLAHRAAINIVLDLVIISKFHVGGITPTVNMQAGISLACNLASAFAGLAYFASTTTVSKRAAVHQDDSRHSIKPSLSALRTLLKPGFVFFTESAIRNALYLWLVHGIVGLGSDYATAWGVFSTIRWGLIMVPVSALEATTLTFVGHSWGQVRARVAHLGDIVQPCLSSRQLWQIVRWACYSVCIVLIFEPPLCLLLSFLGAEPFARYLSGSEEVSKIVVRMWRTIDWCYILYGVSTQLAAILVSTRPRWYLYQSLASNILYVLPWAIVCQVVGLGARDAWTYHSLVFDGSLVFSFFTATVVDGAWWIRLAEGKTRLSAPSRL